MPECVPSRRRCRVQQHPVFSLQGTAARFLALALSCCRDQTLVGKLHSTSAGARLMNRFSIQPQNPAHLSLDRVPICARPLAIGCTLLSSHATPSPLLPLLLFDISLPRPSFTVSAGRCSTTLPPTHPQSLEHSAKFCSTAYRHPHASIDAPLHTLSFLHCLLTPPAHTRARLSRHVLHRRLHHLRHYRES